MLLKCLTLSLTFSLSHTQTQSVHTLTVSQLEAARRVKLSLVNLLYVASSFTGSSGVEGHPLVHLEEIQTFSSTGVCGNTAWHHSQTTQGDSSLALKLWPYRRQTNSHLYSRVLCERRNWMYIYSFCEFFNAKEYEEIRLDYRCQQVYHACFCTGKGTRVQGGNPYEVGRGNKNPEPC